MWLDGAGMGMDDWEGGFVGGFLCVEVRRGCGRGG